MLFLSVTASAISWQYSLKISFNYLFFSSLRNIFNISYAYICNFEFFCCNVTRLFVYTYVLVLSTTFCGQPWPRQLRGICADSTATKLYRSQAFNVDEMRITDKLFHPQKHTSSMWRSNSFIVLVSHVWCYECQNTVLIVKWSASLALHHSLCLDLVEDRLQFCM